MKTLRERILGKAEINRGTGCWEWAGTIDRYGYGKLTVQGVTRIVHRLAYELLVGPIPVGLELDHLCKVPTHALFTPVFDFTDYTGGASPQRSVVDAAFTALEKLTKDEQGAVKALMHHQGRVRVAVHQAFFVGAGGNWALMPFGNPNSFWTAEKILDPGSVWPIIPQPRLKTAYEAARSARFEHGEQG